EAADQFRPQSELAVQQLPEPRSTTRADLEPGAHGAEGCGASGARVLPLLRHQARCLRAAFVRDHLFAVPAVASQLQQRPRRRRRQVTDQVLSERRRLAVLGHPVAHSRSPAMQNAALAELGLAGEWTYEAIDVAPERFDERV